MKYFNNANQQNVFEHDEMTLNLCTNSISRVHTEEIFITFILMISYDGQTINCTLHTEAIMNIYMFFKS